MKRILHLIAFTLLALLLQGCVAWPYRTTPIVTGRVIDADTGKPIAGADVGFQRHAAVSTRTREDGTFRLMSDHKWGPAFIIPAEFTPCGGTLQVSAPGYATFEKDVGSHVYGPIELSELRLKKAVEGR